MATSTPEQAGGYLVPAILQIDKCVASAAAATVPTPTKRRKRRAAQISPE